MVMVLAPPCGAVFGDCTCGSGAEYGLLAPGREKLDGRLEGMHITVHVYTVLIFITFALATLIRMLKKCVRHFFKLLPQI